MRDQIDPDTGKHFVMRKNSDIDREYDRAIYRVYALRENMAMKLLTKSSDKVVHLMVSQRACALRAMFGVSPPVSQRDSNTTREGQVNAT